MTYQHGELIVFRVERVVYLKFSASHIRVPLTHSPSESARPKPAPCPQGLHTVAAVAAELSRKATSHCATPPKPTRSDCHGPSAGCQ